MDHQLTQQRAIDALQRDVCEAHADTLRARGERDKARGEHTRLAGLADGRGYQIEKLEAMVDDLLAACEAAANVYDHLALGPLDAAAKYGPDYEPPSDADCLAVRQCLSDAIAKARGES